VDVGVRRHQVATGEIRSRFEGTAKTRCSDDRVHSNEEFPVASKAVNRIKKIRVSSILFSVDQKRPSFIMFKQIRW
jgi:hypothetical protein